MRPSPCGRVSGLKDDLEQIECAGLNRTAELNARVRVDGFAVGASAQPWRRADMPGNLIYYALVLIAIALVAALLGFGGVSATAMSGASLLVWVAVVVIVIGVVFAIIRRA